MGARTTLAIMVLTIAALVGPPLVFLPPGSSSPSTSLRPDLTWAASPIQITAISPKPGAIIYNDTPDIDASFFDSSGTINPSTVVLFVNGRNVMATDLVYVSSTYLAYNVPAILKLPTGNNTVEVTISPQGQTPASLSWGFNVSSSGPPPAPVLSLSGTQVLVYIAIGVAIFGAAFAAWIGYLRRTRNFRFRKYFATHPIQRSYLTLYVPCVVAFLVVMAGLTFVFSTPDLPWFTTDLVILVGFLVAVTTYGIDARRERARIKAYEAAFAQFLFEMADALRGGIDPAKAILELAKTETDILAKPLRIAADGIRIGKPFDAVLRDMVQGMQSPLITRYAALIADGSSVGGETSAVIYRAAKDMDDFIKIEKERDQQLTLPVGVIYISFGVLVAVLFALLSLAPDLGSLNLGILTSGSFSASSGTSAAPQVPVLGFETLRERFLELSLITSIGNGALIGAFTDGKPKYGIPHSVGMAIGVFIVFIIIYP